MQENNTPGESKSSLDEVIRSPGFIFTVAMMYLFLSPFATSAIRAVLEKMPGNNGNDQKQTPSTCFLSA